MTLKRMFSGTYPHHSWVGGMQCWRKVPQFGRPGRDPWRPRGPLEGRTARRPAPFLLRFFSGKGPVVVTASSSARTKIEPLSGGSSPFSWKVPQLNVAQSPKTSYSNFPFLTLLPVSLLTRVLLAKHSRAKLLPGHVSGKPRFL